MGIGGMFEGFRRWLDGEETVDDGSKPKPRSKWEDYMVAIAREVGAVMQREMFTPPGGPTYIPREYVVFLSSDDDAEWQGEKREGLEKGLQYVVSQRARELGGSSEFQTRTLAIELRTDTSLARGQFRVQPVWDREAERTKVTPRKPPTVTEAAPPATQTAGSPATAASAEAEDDSTVVRPRTRQEVAKVPLFSVGVARESADVAPNATPDIRQFFKEKITVGRGSKQVSVDIRLEGDLEISREHVSIEFQNGRFAVTCLGRNSIFVDSAEVLMGETAVAQPGQKISVCSYVLTLAVVAP
jgi:hypothetical protein